MTTYAIDNGNSEELCSGLSEQEAHRVAQDWADRLGEPVYLYETGSEGEPEEIEPDHRSAGWLNI